jgi:uncharacterized protein involved in exopolysaccharide biosynthesis
LRRLARRDLPTTPKPSLRKPEPPVAPKVAPVAPVEAAWPVLTVATLMAWTRRGLVWIAILAVLGTGTGMLYGLLATPKYTTFTDLIIDPSNLQLVTDDLYKSPIDQNAQLLNVESKMRVITSGNVLKRVVGQLNLTADPEFTDAPGLFGLRFLSGKSDEASGDATLDAVDALEKRVGTWREERSYVVSIAVSTTDPQKSVKIANAVVDAFQAELAKGEADGASRASAALMQRLAELRASVTEAEGAVEAFKSAHNLQESNGELVNSQTMTQLNKAMIDAQAALIAAQARYEELTDPKTGRANADAVQTQTMVELRKLYGQLKQEADAAASMFGPLHPTRATAERQLKGLQGQIALEASRAVQAAKSDLVQAQRTVAQLTEQAAAARTTVSVDDAAEVELNNLVRDAKARSDVYEAFLTRAREMTEREQLDTTNVRVISPATPPMVRSWPPRGVVTASLGAGAGLGLGIALALGVGWLGAVRRLRATPKA